MDSTTYTQNFKPLACFCDFTGWFVSDLVRNSEDRPSRVEAQIKLYLQQFDISLIFSLALRRHPCSRRMYLFRLYTLSRLFPLRCLLSSESETAHMSPSITTSLSLILLQLSKILSVYSLNNINSDKSEV